MIGLETNNQEIAVQVIAWWDVGPRVTHVRLGIVVVNLRGASGKTPYWILLMV
jgi:hypothetical protein